MAQPPKAQPKPVSRSPIKGFNPLVSYEVPLIGRVNKPDVPWLIALFPLGVAVALWPGDRKVTFSHLTALCATYQFTESHVFLWKRIPNAEAYLMSNRIQETFTTAKKTRDAS